MTDRLGLGEAYGATIGRIKAQGGDKSRLGIAALMWISHAERLLRADELCHALAIDLGSADFNAGIARFARDANTGQQIRMLRRQVVKRDEHVLPCMMETQ